MQQANYILKGHKETYDTRYIVTHDTFSNYRSYCLYYFVSFRYVVCITLPLPIGKVFIIVNLIFTCSIQYLLETRKATEIITECEYMVVNLVCTSSIQYIFETRKEIKTMVDCKFT